MALAADTQQAVRAGRMSSSEGSSRLMAYLTFKEQASAADQGESHARSELTTSQNGSDCCSSQGWGNSSAAAQSCPAVWGADPVGVHSLWVSATGGDARNAAVSRPLPGFAPLGSGSSDAHDARTLQEARQSGASSLPSLFAGSSIFAQSSADAW